MRYEICPGCCKEQPVNVEGRFVIHGCDSKTHKFCPWAGRLAIDFKRRVNYAQIAIRKMYPLGLPKNRRRRRKKTKHTVELCSNVEG